MSSESLNINMNEESKLWAIAGMGLSLVALGAYTAYSAFQRQGHALEVLQQQSLAQEEKLRKEAEEKEKKMQAEKDRAEEEARKTKEPDMTQTITAMVQLQMMKMIGATNKDDELHT
jgi:hypothetical protein